MQTAATAPAPSITSDHVRSAPESSATIPLSIAARVKLGTETLAAVQVSPKMVPAATVRFIGLTVWPRRRHPARRSDAARVRGAAMTGRDYLTGGSRTSWKNAEKPASAGVPVQVQSRPG